MVKVEDIIRKREGSATRPIFDDDEDEKDKEVKPTIKTPDRPALDLARLTAALRYEDVATLEAAVRKLEKATRSMDEPAGADRADRGVREL